MLENLEYAKYLIVDQFSAFSIYYYLAKMIQRPEFFYPEYINRISDPDF